jgi:hypothetical protein
LQSDNLEQQQTILQLEEENRKYIEMLIRYGKGDKSAAMNNRHGNNAANEGAEFKERSDSFGANENQRGGLSGGHGGLGGGHGGFGNNSAGHGTGSNNREREFGREYTREQFTPPSNKNNNVGLLNT